MRRDRFLLAGGAAAALALAVGVWRWRAAARRAGRASRPRGWTAAGWWPG
jgi:hypothetical protein